MDAMASFSFHTTNKQKLEKFLILCQLLSWKPKNRKGMLKKWLPSKLTKKRRSKAIHKNKSNLKKKQSKSLKMSRSLNKMKKMVSKRSRKEEASLRQKRMGSHGRKTPNKVLITKSRLKWETLITWTKWNMQKLNQRKTLRSKISGWET